MLGKIGSAFLLVCAMATAVAVAPVANAIYKGDTDVIVLVIDPDLVHAEIRYDQVPGWNDPFPHIYGPLNTDAVVGTIPLSQDEAGQFVFTAE